MTKLIIAVFVLQFLLILRYFTNGIKRYGFNFKNGLAFGVLYFIFIPLWVLIITGKIPLVKTDFGRTTLSDVVLIRDIKASWILIAYLFSFILYLYFSKPLKVPDKIPFKPRFRAYFILYFLITLVILVGSGLLKGGNWYDSRHQFMVQRGAFAVLLIYLRSTIKILIIASFVYLWLKGKLSAKKYFLYVFGFTLLDMFLTGNRIYIFTALVITAIVLIKRRPVLYLTGLPVLLPVVYYVGYFLSIFRHIRGPLFAKGIPTFEVFMAAFRRAVRLNPPELSSFFLNISESVNVNVLYDIFNRYRHILYGATYLKLFIFYIPRSVWPSKPESITKIAGHFFGAGGSLVTTLFGELHMNFLYVGIFLLPFLLFFTEYILYKIKVRSELVNYVHFIFGILIFRMPYSDEMIIYLFLIILVYLLNIKFVHGHKAKRVQHG